VPNPHLVDCVIEDERWIPLGLEALAERAGRATLSRLGLSSEGFEVCLLAANDARVAELNGLFRDRAAPTNVLSWPSEERGAAAEGTAPEPPVPGDADDPEPLGDIALAYETCAAEAGVASLPLADHVAHLVVHGVLHLLGYDHMRDGDAALMESIEAGILATMGVGDPYANSVDDGQG